VLVHLLLNIFFAAVIPVASTHFEAGKKLIDLVGLKTKTCAWGRGIAKAGDLAPVKSL